VNAVGPGLDVSGAAVCLLATVGLSALVLLLAGDPRMSPNGTRRRMRRNGPSSVSYRKPDGAWKEVPGHAGGKIWAIVDDEARATGNYNAVVYKDEDGEWSGELYFTKFPLRPEDRVSADAAKRATYDEWYRLEDEMARTSAEERAETDAFEKKQAKKRKKKPLAWHRAHHHGYVLQRGEEAPVAFIWRDPNELVWEAGVFESGSDFELGSFWSKESAEKAALEAGQKEMALRDAGKARVPTRRLEPPQARPPSMLGLRMAYELVPPKLRTPRKKKTKVTK